MSQYEYQQTQHFVAQFSFNMSHNQVIVSVIILCCIIDVNSQEISLVRFPSLKSIFDAMKGFLETMHRRTFFTHKTKPEKPSYLPKPSYKHVKSPLQIHSSEEFKPVMPPPSYTPNPTHYYQGEPKPSYLNFWSYFPLGQITPLNILAGIKAASEEVEHDGE